MSPSKEPHPRSRPFGPRLFYPTPKLVPTRLLSIHETSKFACVVECRICNREVSGSNIGLCYFAPRSTQPSIHSRSVNEYQMRLGTIAIADEKQGGQVKLCYPLTMPAIPERLRDASCRGAIQIDYRYLYLRVCFDVWLFHGFFIDRINRSPCSD